MANWHYLVNGQQNGPVDDAALSALMSQGTVLPETLVWREGMDGWKPAGEVAEARALAAGATRATPPIAPTGVTPQPGPGGGDAMSGIIPYKNPPALIAYYLGIVSLLPCVGIPLAIAAIVLGIIGLRRYKRIPESKGVVHAWIGIVLGALVLLVSVPLIILLSLQ